jgi:ribosome-binding protein aMBF1 (putative translation factor)
MDMASDGTDRWSQLRARALRAPEDQEQYRRTRESTMAIRRVLQVIDVERERAGLSKSELARRIGASPATVRRLFTSPSANPTLKTIVDLFDALEVDMELRSRRESASSPE